MFKWKKLGIVFDPREIKDRSWLNEFAQAPSVLVYDNFIRVYFSCRPLPDENKQYVSYSSYIDLDRKNIFEIINVAKEPILKLGDRGTFDEFGTYPVSVIKYDNSLIAYYGGWTRCESVPFNVGNPSLNLVQDLYCHIALMNLLYLVAPKSGDSIIPGIYFT